MKKGLLSILAGALLVVGCQNYDDQFDQLESQINALASTVAGLSAVQSDLAALSAQVNGLSGAVDAAVDSALAGGLAQIQEAIDALNAAAESAANNSDITQIAEDVDEVQTDLAELLAQSSVFSDNVVVNTNALLEAFHAMGSGLAIVNGYVDIDTTADMDQTMVQELVDFIKVTTGEFNFKAGTDIDTEITFNNLAATATLTLEQEGGYVAQALESATVVTLVDDSTVDIVDLRALTTVTSLSDGTTAGDFTFAKAVELHLTSLPRYTPKTISLGVDEGGVIDISALTDADADGDAHKLLLTISGPDNLTISTLSGDKEGSKITASEIINLTVNGYDGTVEIGQDVQNFSSDNLVGLSVTGDDLVTFTATGAVDPNDDDDEQGPVVALANDGDLETVTLDGTFESVSLDTNGNMTDVTIGGTVTGAAGISITSNSDLVNMDVSAATTDKFVLTGNSDLEVVTVDFTTAAANGADAQIGHIKVDNNESMTSLTIGTDNVDILEITNNADLEEVDLSAMSAIGATGKASVTIANNNLEASDADEGDESFTTESGLDTAKNYLDAVAADADSKANVRFDLVDTVTDEDDAETSDVADYAVLVLTPRVVTTEGKDAIKSRRAVVISDAQLTANTTFSVLTKGFGGAHILVAGDETPGAQDLDANQTLAIAEIKRAAALTRAEAYDLVLDAHKGAFPTGKITFENADADSENSTTATGTIGDIRSDDYLNLTIDGITVSATAGAALSTASDVAARISAIWNIDAKYGPTQASAAYTIWNVTHTANDAFIEISARTGSGRRGYDKSYSFALVAATSTTTPVLGWQYGATEGAGDNNTISGGIVVTVESAAAGTLLDTATNVSFYLEMLQ